MAASILGLLTAGCSTMPGQPMTSPPPPPLPPATRGPVLWADTMCGIVNSVDGLRARIDSVNRSTAAPGSSALSYVLEMSRSVENFAKALKDVKPSGVVAADGYTAELVKTVEGLRVKLPSSDDRTMMAMPEDQRPARAQQIAAVVATIEPQGPKLARLAGTTRDLVASFVLAPNCEPVPLPARSVQPDPPAPTRALVGWSDTICQGATALAGLRTDPGKELVSDDPRFAQFAGVELAQYVSAASRQVDQIGRQLAPLAPTGVKEADDFRAGLVSALQAAVAKLPRSERTGPMFEAPIDQLKAQAAQVAGVLAELKPKGGDLAGVTGRTPVLKKSYALAPHCEPPSAPVPMPIARNGTDVAACAAGQCQIRLAGKVDVTVSGLKFSFAVDGDRLTITDDMSRMRLGQGGDGAIGTADKKVRFHVAWLSGGTAVLDISTT